MPLSVMLLPNTAYFVMGPHHPVGSHKSISPRLLLLFFFFLFLFSCKTTKNCSCIQTVVSLAVDWNHFVFIKHKSSGLQNKPQANPSTYARKKKCRVINLRQIGTLKRTPLLKNNSVCVFECLRSMFSPKICAKSIHTPKI